MIKNIVIINVKIVQIILLKIVLFVMIIEYIIVIQNYVNVLKDILIILIQINVKNVIFHV